MSPEIILIFPNACTLIWKWPGDRYWESNSSARKPLSRRRREMVVLYGKLGIVVCQKRLVSYAGRAKEFSANHNFQKLIFMITKKIFILKLAFFLPNFHSRNIKKWGIHPSTVSHLRRDELLSMIAASVMATELVHMTRLEQMCH